MPHRIITDPTGASWQVWAVHPTEREGARTLAPEYQQGWLAFERLEAPVEKRRYAPVPPAWDVAPEPHVLALLAAARPVVSRSVTA